MISIAMTAYNGQDYISKQLDSVLNQSITDFEVIICDDCSSDKTREILEDYKNKDSRVKVYFNEKNLGFLKNYEKAISLCSGDYIALCDQDDIWTENHLEILLNLIGDADIACGNAELIDDNGCSKGILLSQSDGFDVVYKGTDLLYRLLCRGNFFQGASMLFKRSFIQNKNVLNMPEGIGCHDAWFAACGALLNGINYTYDVITMYRMHGDNASGQHEKYSFFDRIKNAFRDLFSKEKYTTDRLIYIDEMKRRFDLSQDKIDLLDKCYKFHQFRKGELKFKEKLSCLKWYWKNYKYILTTDSNKYRFSRIIKLIV